MAIACRVHGEAIACVIERIPGDQRGIERLRRRCIEPRLERRRITEPRLERPASTASGESTGGPPSPSRLPQRNTAHPTVSPAIHTTSYQASLRDIALDGTTGARPAQRLFLRTTAQHTSSAEDWACWLPARSERYIASCGARGHLRSRADPLQRQSPTAAGLRCSPTLSGVP